MIRGRLQRWNDDKGFGFIRPLNASGDVFVHISAFKGMPRRPVVGDVINYSLETDREGRSRAIKATIEGSGPVRPRRGPSGSVSRARRRSGSRLKPVFVTTVFVIAVASVALSQDWSGIAQFFGVRLSEKTDSYSDMSVPSARSDSPLSYRCEGKVYCSEMRSCEEARFYLRNCPGTKMDGDRDGLPCERQWCGW
ncbi:excalibur calcium-binding domain-containing protein [Thiorhodococcus minor]|uniref:Cold shock domain-containing protein n=1 Tax=Thiorhodococcus minor TaxID=57489 RepID=A0A6M0JZI2_9GAMM|nr:cold shock domain-containing protein [Thiorhodococcus minor]